MGDLNIGFSAVAAGTADAITATYSPAITLTDRRIVFLTGCVANLTTTPTFNPNVLGAQVIKGKGGAALKVGEITGDCILIYHTTGTYWELLTSNYRPEIDAAVLTAAADATTKANAAQAASEPVGIFRQTVKLGWAMLTGLASTSYRPSPILVPQTALTSANAAYQFKTNRAISSFIVFVSYARGGAPGTTGDVSIVINNITKSTTVTVGILDILTNNVGCEVYAATLACDANDSLEITFDTPAWTANPTNWRIGVDISF